MLWVLKVSTKYVKQIFRNFYHATNFLIVVNMSICTSKLVWASKRNPNPSSNIVFYISSTWTIYIYHKFHQNVNAKKTVKYVIGNLRCVGALNEGDSINYIYQNRIVVSCRMRDCRTRQLASRTSYAWITLGRNT